MALIKCPECGKEISDKASACIHCGCPIHASVADALIRFENEYGGFRYKCTVTCNGKEYSCKIGESINIPISKPSEVEIHIGGGNGSTSGTIMPGRKYHVTRTGLFGLKPTLSEY